MTDKLKSQPGTFGGTHWILPAVILGLLAAPALGQLGKKIGQTRHNLSSSGPGQFKSMSETKVCIFCHSPHLAGKTKGPLWNRGDTTTTYLTYKSSTFKGTISQPNGTTKLCLSCHDGTVALGKVYNRKHEVPMGSGRRFLNTGKGYLGTNLEDDHPVSFSYLSSQGVSGDSLRPAANIPKPIKLDDKSQVQCTTCHDPHDNSHGFFLRTTTLYSAICLACHTPAGWATSAHATSPARWNVSGQNPQFSCRHDSVAENACASCHKNHGAGRAARLLNFSAEEDNCLHCHNGSIAKTNIQSLINRPFSHDPEDTTGIHDPTEDPQTMSRHVECQDCHNPHQAKAASVPAPGVPGPIMGVSGINSSGATVQRISFGYELCYKCHSERHGSTIHVPRQIAQANVRLEFDPGNPSFHPIETQGVNNDVPSLISPWTTSSIMTCWDCHSSRNSPAFGGTGPAGPHGSNNRPLLGLPLMTADYTSESQNAYALCYRCHSRSSILSDTTFKEHSKHIVDEKTPCTVCHDPHGVSSTQGNINNNSRLINFDTSIVFASNGILRFEDTGFRQGRCTLICHEENHNPETY